MWWKNTFFWIAAALLVLGIFGAIKGEEVIRDPGQVRETGIVWIYIGAAAVMLVNGFLTHRQAVQQYREQEGVE